MFRQVISRLSRGSLSRASSLEGDIAPSRHPVRPVGSAAFNFGLSATRVYEDIDLFSKWNLMPKRSVSSDRSISLIASESFVGCGGLADMSQLSSFARAGIRATCTILMHIARGTT